MRLLGFLLIFALLIAYLLINATEWVNTPLVRDIIVGRILRPFWATADLGRSEVELKNGTAKIYSAAVYDTEGRLIAKAPYARIHFHLFNLFWREVKLEEIEIDHGDVHLWTDADGVFIWKRFKKPPKPNRITTSRAGMIIAHEGTFTYDYYPVHRPIHLRIEGVNGTAKFNDKTPYIEATARSMLLQFPGFDHYFYDIVVKGRMEEDYAEVYSLDANFLDMPIKVRGRLDGLKSKNPRLNCSLEVTSTIGKALKYFNYNDNPPGPFTLTAKVTGRTDDYQVAGHFSSQWGIVEGQRYDDASADFVYHSNDKNIRLTRYKFKMYGAQIAGSGWYNIDTRRFSGSGAIQYKNHLFNYDVAGIVNTRNGIITLKKLDLRTPYAKLFSNGTWATKTGLLYFHWTLDIYDMRRELPEWGLDDIGGSIKLTGTLSGPLKDPYVTSMGTGRSLEWWEFKLGDGPVSLDLENGQVTLKAGPSREGTSFYGELQFPFIEDGRLTDLDTVQVVYKYEIDNMVFDNEFFGTDLFFRASGYIEGGGTFSNLSGKGHTRLTDVKAWGQSIEYIEADVAMDEVGMSFSNAVIKLPGGDAGAGHLSFDWDLNYTFEITTDRLNLSSLNAISKSGRPVNGVAQANIRGKANFRDPKFNGEFILQSVTYETLVLQGSQFTFEMTGSVVRLRGRQDWGLDIDGEYNFSTGAFKDFVISFERFNVAPITEWKCVGDLSGYLTGSVTLNGGEAGWDGVDYHFYLTELDIVYHDIKIWNSGPVISEIGPQGGDQNVPLISDYGWVNIMGKISPRSEWDLSIMADFDLSAIPKFVDKVRESSGRVHLNMTAVGPSDEIVTAGQFTIDNGAMRFRNYSAEFTGITALIEFTPRFFDVKYIKGNIADEGNFFASGKIYTENFEILSVDIALKADKIPLRSPNTYKASISPNLTLQGPPQALALKGRIAIDEGLYIKDVRIERQVIEVTRETAPPPKLPEWLNNLVMDIEIVNEGNFLINNNLTETPLRINLNVRGKINEPEVDGAIEAIGGKIYYSGTVFNIVRGRFDFADPLKIDPAVDVFANTIIREYEIRLYVIGNLSHMELKLESSPALDDQNILALITFQKTVEELTQGQQQDLINLSLFFSRDVSRAVGGPLENYTGIDIFTVEAREASPGARVTVGKRLSKRIEVQYSTEMGGEAPLQETRLIYKITDNIWLQGSQTSMGVYSFKLNFHFVIE